MCQLQTKHQHKQCRLKIITGKYSPFNPKCFISFDTKTELSVEVNWKNYKDFCAILILKISFMVMKSACISDTSFIVCWFKWRIKLGQIPIRKKVRWVVLAEHRWDELPQDHPWALQANSGEALSFPKTIPEPCKQVPISWFSALGRGAMRGWGPWLGEPCSPNENCSIFCHNF